MYLSAIKVENIFYNSVCLVSRIYCFYFDIMFKAESILFSEN